jgi:hypothetical protein
MELVGDKNSAKFCSNYYCKNCDYNTCKKSSYDDHLLSAKHQKTIIGDAGDKNSAVFIPNKKNFICENCNKSYMSRNGLWKHKNKGTCKEVNANIIPLEITQETIMSILKQNSEFQQMLLEQNKTIIELSKNNQTNYSHNNTNSLNKTFNLQFFLNETCKDAMNIMDFVDSIKLQLSDLENVGKIGYVEGISNIITKNLKALDVTQRPIHCTDKKRETVYVRDEDKWEKEDEEKKTLKKAIKRVVSKNFMLLPKFKEAHPDYGKASSKFSDQYNKIIIESCGGSGDNDAEKENKIIKNISKVTTID